MLSRNAERIYWLGRYIERAEDTARLLNAFSQLVLDLPRSNKPDWDVLLKIMAAEAQFYENHTEASEDNVIAFLLNDVNNPGSIRSGVKAARENARTLKDRLPLEGWEMLNDLNLFIKRNANDAPRQRNRFQFLTSIISKCQRFNGMISTTMSRNQAYEFLCMGMFIERIDMTIRTLNITTDILLSRPEDSRAFDSHIWMEILKAQNAVSMYRNTNGPRLSPKVVLRFLIGDRDFPRSMKHCLTGMQQLVSALPDNHLFTQQADSLLQNLETYKTGDEIVLDDLRQFFDDTQRQANELNQTITNTWFLDQIADSATQSQHQS